VIWLALIPSLVLAALLWREAQRTDNLLSAHAAERADWESARDDERAEWGKERRQLLNRVQRPETAVYEDFEPSLEKAYVGFDDDEQFAEAVSNGRS
jgi:hypothetical protein